MIILTLHAIAELWVLADAASVLPAWAAVIHSAIAAVLPLRALSPAAQRVFWCAWVTDACTGAGALPFLFVRSGLSPRWVAAANAAAGGMMLAASGLLVVEAAAFELPAAVLPALGDSEPALGLLGALVAWIVALPSVVHMAAGVAAGVAFVRGSQAVLHSYEGLKFSGFDGACVPSSPRRGGGSRGARSRPPLPRRSQALMRSACSSSSPS